MKRHEQLQHTLWNIEKKWGQGTIRSAADVDQRLSVPTGFDVLDRALQAGGIAVGRVAVLTGVPTSGATTCAYQIIASGQRKSGFAAYIDLAANFDPEAAVACGVVLPHLLLIRSGSVEHGLEISRDILLANAAAVLVIDLCGVGALSITIWERLADAAMRSNCATVLLVDGSSPAIESIAQTWLTFERQSWLRDQTRVRGCLTHIHILKDKPHVKTPLVPLHILFGELID